MAAVEARLTAKPDDGKGWAVIAPVYMRLQRYSDAAHAYAEALRLLGEEPLRRAAYGEALVAAAGGVVTDEARQAFDRALTEQPGQPQARYYLALATEQDGKKADAIRDYQALLANSAPDAPWRNMVNAHLAALKGEPAPAMEAAAIPEAQRPMIEGMVSKLATRLASNGGGVDEWSRLIRAYTVLHEADKAKAALVDAHKALASDANAVASLDALAAIFASEMPIDPPWPPPCADRRCPRRHWRSGWSFALRAERQHRVPLQPVRSRPESGRAGSAAADRGPVKTGSVVKSADQKVAFVITDGAHDLKVAYQGLLPDLFREGQGVVAEGVLARRRMRAETIVAKHDERYMPREVVDALKKQGRLQEGTGRGGADRNGGEGGAKTLRAAILRRMLHHFSG